MNEECRKQLSEPMTDVLLKFLQGASPETSLQTALGMILTITSNQIMGVKGGEVTPSIIAITSEDPDAFAAATNILHLLDQDDLERAGKEAASEESLEDARQTMHTVVAEANRSTSTTKYQGDSPVQEMHYRDARAIAYGNCDSQRYTEAWHPSLGLITGASDSIILKLMKQEDKDAFLQDLQKKESRLKLKKGPSKDLVIREKEVSISGSLSHEECNDAAVDALLKLGQPCFLLPIPPLGELDISNKLSLRVFGGLLKGPKIRGKYTKPHLPSAKLIQIYQAQIWRSLNHLPYDSRFGIIDFVHKLESVCEAMVECARDLDGDFNQNAQTLLLDLYLQTLRGLALSMAYLAWYGYGFNAGLPLGKVRRLLSVIRSEGEMSLRDVQRAVGLKTADNRDFVLSVLSSEGLVRVEGKKVIATSWSDFVAILYAAIPTRNRKKRCEV